MTLDFMEDALDSLEEGMDHYVLCYGRQGDCKTIVNSNLYEREQLDVMIKH